MLQLPRDRCIQRKFVVCEKPKYVSKKCADSSVAELLAVKFGLQLAKALGIKQMSKCPVFHLD